MVFMEHGLTQKRQQAHPLLDMLADEKVAVVSSLLRVPLEPLSRSLASAQAEEDDISPRAAAALDRSRSSLARGEGISHEEIRREFGLQK
jgi:hypothetical protein